jgi:hypothetical protein
MLVDSVAQTTKALVSAGVRRQRLIDRGKRDRPAEQRLCGYMDVPDSQRSTGLLKNGRHCVEHGALAAAKGVFGSARGRVAAGQQDAKPHQPWKLKLESRVQECSA